MIKYIGKQIRISKNFTVRGLAEAAQIAPSSISKWENGTHLPDLETLDLVATALGVKPWQLIEFKSKGEDKNERT
jgi:transcriptional regulator with XRE-family HTH domain